MLLRRGDDWQRSYGTGLVEWATAAAVTSDGGILVLGQCAPPEAGIADDIWVLKLATTGEVEWQKRIGGAAIDLGEQVFQTADGGISSPATRHRSTRVAAACSGS